MNLFVYARTQVETEFSGTICACVPARRYYFIKNDQDGSEIFAHCEDSNLPQGHLCLFSVSAPVLYEVQSTPKGPRAINVSLDTGKISIQVSEIEESTVTSWQATNG